MPTDDERSGLEHNRSGRLTAEQAAWLAEQASVLKRFAAWTMGGGTDDLRSRAAGVPVDVAEGRVACVDGEVVWAFHGGWSARPASGGMDLYLREGLKPLPGPYRFYYCPRSRFVVSLEALGSSDPSQPNTQHFARYREWLFWLVGIDGQGADALRRGELPSGLGARALVAPWERLVPGVLGSLLAVCGLFMLLAGVGGFAGAWFVLFGLLLAYLFTFRLRWQLAADRRAARVTVSEGHVAIVRISSGWNTEIFVELNGDRYECHVQGALLAAVFEGPHRAYLAPKTRWVVALEPLH